ncbi:RICIN domain-containing protein [Candidatus Protofrankia californiensis]|uniref:RICIN domain-containing protein n=1 Tax=Candidatus Protofrankia californiensis TaxID=1839754 RepID=UPI00104111F9|nr:RICIN domain-containing protein [Candidatus Protofrankia californiensis]
MASVPNGPYAIARLGENLLTLEGGSSRPGSPVVILPPTGNPGEQEWALQALDNGSYTIRNLTSGTYLGFEGDPYVNKPIAGYPDPREWSLYPSPEASAFHIVVPGGPVDGEELAVDFSLLRIFPPRSALRPLDAGIPGQAWTFQPIE